jgi:hypothetical protein
VDFTGTGKKQCKKACRLPGDGGVDLTKRDAGESGCVDYKNCLPFLVSSGTSSSTFGFCNEP